MNSDIVVGGATVCAHIQARILHLLLLCCVHGLFQMASSLSDSFEVKEGEKKNYTKQERAIYHAQLQDCKRLCRRNLLPSGKSAENLSPSQGLCCSGGRRHIMDLQVLQFGALQAVRGISSSYVMSAVPQEAQRASKAEFGTWTVKTPELRNDAISVRSQI